MEDIEIHSQFPGISAVLSNLHRKPFLMKGTAFESIEGFLQGMRVKDVAVQKSIFLKHGIDAKKVGRLYPIKNQTLYWKGVPLNRHSDQYKVLCRNAFECCFAQNHDFRLALAKSIGYNLVHSIGKNDPFDTILTNDEFLGNLNYLRDKYSTVLNDLLKLEKLKHESF